VQDRDGARLVLDRRTRRLFPFIERIFADTNYQGPKMAVAAAKTGTWTLEIVKRNELHRFVVLPKRWIVERTLAWILDQPLPPLGQRLRASRPKGRRLHPPRHDPTHAPSIDSTFAMNRNFPERLLGPRVSPGAYLPRSHT
jgi:transposase